MDDYKNCGEGIHHKEIDLLFIGTVHSDRWLFLKEIKKQAENHNFKVFYYLYIQSPIIFFVRKIFDKRLSSLPFKDIRFHSMPRKDVVELMKNTRAVVDIQHPKQTGLTMRTIEIIGARIKLITTNSTIKEYDCYSENNIAIIDRKSPILDFDFWTTDYVELLDDIYDKYSIDGWIKDVFSTL